MNAVDVRNDGGSYSFFILFLLSYPSPVAGADPPPRRLFTQYLVVRTQKSGRHLVGVCRFLRFFLECLDSAHLQVLLQGLHLGQLLPGQIQIGTAEVAIGCGLLIDCLLYTSRCV